MSPEEKKEIINAALCSLGILRPGEIISTEDYRYIGRELDGILATLHLTLAKQIAATYRR